VLGVKNTIYFPTPISLEQKDTEKLPYLATVLRSLKYTIQRGDRTLSVRCQVISPRDEERCAEACRNHTRLTVPLVVIVTI
jgi:phosphorylcholine metabolism protein LicD